LTVSERDRRGVAFPRQGFYLVLVELRAGNFICSNPSAIGVEHQSKISGMGYQLGARRCHAAGETNRRPLIRERMRPSWVWCRMIRGLKTWATRSGMNNF